MLWVNSKPLEYLSHVPDVFAVEQTSEAEGGLVHGDYITPYSRRQGINNDASTELAIPRVALELRKARLVVNENRPAREPWYLDPPKVLR